MVVRLQQRWQLCFMVLDFLVGTGRRSALAFVPFSASISRPSTTCSLHHTGVHRCCGCMLPLNRGLSLRATAEPDNNDNDSSERSPECNDSTDGEGEKELVGLVDFYERKAEKETRDGIPTVGLGLEGGIFPGDVSPSSADKDIKLQGAKLDPGQPQVLVGFWQVRGRTGCLPMKGLSQAYRDAILRTQYTQRIIVVLENALFFGTTVCLY